MPERSSIGCTNDDLALTDRDLFSLYLRYPEMEQLDVNLEGGDYAEPLLASITASSPDSSPQSAQLDSSPPSNSTYYESPASSPLGPSDSIPFPDLAIAANDGEVEELSVHFDLTRRSHEIPERAAELFTEIKSAILSMGSILFTTTGEVSTEPENLWHINSIADWLISVLSRAGIAVDMEIDDIQTILQLAPFTIRPALKDLWTNYKQMAELIIDCTTMPSQLELDLWDQLCHIYDACVYRPFLAIPRSQGYNEALLEKLDMLYNTIMTHATRYKKWMVAMKRVGNDFTKPTMRRILQSPEVMKGILEFEGQLEVAAQSVVQLEIATREVLATLTAKDRREQQQSSKHQPSALHRGFASIS
ncbi:hypothetical protein EPUS_08897 [Endocarpon pusillum Z07020]|uniref:Uncharacterized protein n=1 Tax=Endocarpon pusillum (strain Z07020 / HMAS-L-300199) TaxID=1263415 RepID=U1GPE9_ENDPU|nr:uncharacterized protein EPUS_08897 [Endocarpon pusillum Z07020]ERF74158.1 hypothetical protein EPUS_08897 [Endocarpon pusillum Z07020]